MSKEKELDLKGKINTAKPLPVNRSIQDLTSGVPYYPLSRVSTDFTSKPLISSSSNIDHFGLGFRSNFSTHDRDYNPLAVKYHSNYNYNLRSDFAPLGNNYSPDRNKDLSVNIHCGQPINNLPKIKSLVLDRAFVEKMLKLNLRVEDFKNTELTKVILELDFSTLDTRQVGIIKELFHYNDSITHLDLSFMKYDSCSGRSNFDFIEILNLIGENNCITHLSLKGANKILNKYITNIITSLDAEFKLTYLDVSNRSEKLKSEELIKIIKLCPMLSYIDVDFKSSSSEEIASIIKSKSGLTLNVTTIIDDEEVMMILKTLDDDINGSNSSLREKAMSSRTQIYKNSVEKFLSNIELFMDGGKADFFNKINKPIDQHLGTDCTDIVMQYYIDTQFLLSQNLFSQEVSAIGDVETL